MLSRLLYIIKFYISIIAIFIIAKPLFMLYNVAGHHFSAYDIYEVIIHGLTLDLSTVIYFTIIPLLFMSISLWWDKWNVIRKIIKYYYGIIAFAFATIFVTDASLYAFWNFKLDSSVFQYIDSTGDAFVSVSYWYIFIRIFIIILIGYAIYKLLVKLTPLSFDKIKLKTKVISSFLIILFIYPIIIGIRGGTSEATTNVGQVYYSSDQFLNHSAINPVFSFFASFERTADDNADYNFFNEKKCHQLFSGLYNTESINDDSLLNTTRPNIVIIEMEGCGGIFTKIGGHSDIMPNLNKLAEEGVYFTNCYGNSYRTDRGTICNFSGYPSFPNTSVMKIPSKSRTLPSIAKKLVKEGYATNFIYGGDIDFTNMRSYLLSTGYKKTFSKENYSPSEQNTSKWGVRDDITFNTLYQQIIHHKEEHWHTGFLTLSSHEPWIVPIHRFKSKEYNAFAYLDDCIGNFVNKIKKTPQWKNILIIFVPDHGINYLNIDETTMLRNHIPMIWIGGAVKKPYIVEKFCNQTDLAATLLGQMKINHDEFTFSRDVMSQTYQYPFAYHTYNNGLSVIDSTGFSVFDLDANKAITEKPDHSPHRINMGKAILQMTSLDLKNRK